MLTDITNSIKAKLYDFTYTPFMSSVLISWIVINHTYLLIYFGDSKLEEKLTLLNDYNSSMAIGEVEVPYSLNIILPILFGLFYVFIYPLISKIFYEYTLERTKALKKIKQNIEDETPVTQEEARKVREDIDRLRESRDEVLSKLRTVEDKYKTKLSDAIKPIRNELETYQQSVEKLTSENKDLNNKLSQANQFLSAKNEQNESLEKQITSQQNDIDTEVITIAPDIKVSKEKYPKQRKEDRALILEYLYNSYETTYEKNLLDEIVNSTAMARAKARNIINALIEEKVLEKNNINQLNITKEGGKRLEEAFEKKKSVSTGM